MRYVLRADASSSVGAGHVMRSSAIAEELISRGKEVVFVGQTNELSWLSSRILSLGFAGINTNSNDFKSDPKNDVLILDSYLIPINDSFIQREKWVAVVTIIDEHTPQYDADLSIHPGFTNEKKLRGGKKLISGPEYIPFRKNIQKVDYMPENLNSVEITVVGGGANTFNFADKICEVLSESNRNFRASIFSDTLDPTKFDSRFAIIASGENLDNYANCANLVYTTASTTSLEFIARELPVGVGCAVENQKDLYQNIISLGFAISIGEYQNDKWHINQENVLHLLDSAPLRESLIKNCYGIIDLFGARRIADEITRISL
jgi:spore coat polysaccharide biosynthesis predicted glycosyltransferase SpsG